MIRSVAILLLLANASVPEYGALRVVSEPGAVVVWDGVELGTIGPAGLLKIEEIPLGRYELTVRKPGFRERASEVEVGPGATTLSWGLELERPPVGGDALSVQPPSPPPPARLPADSPASVAAESIDNGSGSEGAALQPAASELVVSESAPLDPPAETSPGAAESPPQRGVGGYWIAALALGGGVLWWLLWNRGRRSAGSAAAPGSPVPAPAEESTAGASNLPEPMLEKLRQREAAIEGGEPASAAEPSAPVIDVVDFEVIEEET